MGVTAQIAEYMLRASKRSFCVDDPVLTSYDPTTYLNQQATTAPFVSREASAAERLRSSRVIGNLKSTWTVTALIGTWPLKL